MEVVILAGGGGVRLWPASRAGKPKQFLSIPSGDSLLQATVNRAKKLVPEDRIWIVTLKDYVKLTQKQLPKFNPAQIFGEPEGKNSAPAICAITLYLQALRKKPTTVLVLTADHLIPMSDRFISTMKKGMKRAAEGHSLITFGLKVKSPRTDFGYIHAQGKLKNGVRSVKRFVEKPPINLAKKFAQSKDYYWNSGMFVWRSDVFSREMLEHAHDIFSPMSKLDWTPRSIKQHLPSIYASLKGRSIDYALMERSACVEVVPSSFVWSDVGTWSAVHAAHGKGSRANVSMGDGTVIEGRGNLILSEKKPVYLFGVNDLVVVETEEATMVTTQEASKNLKKYLEKLKG